MLRKVSRIICAEDVQWLIASKCTKRSQSTVASELNKTLTKPEGWDEAKPFEALPGPKPYPLIGNIWRFMPVIGDLYGLQGHQMFERFYKEYGDIMCLQGILNNKPIAVLFNPQAIETMYRNESSRPFRKPIEVALYYRTVTRKEKYDGILNLANANEEEWYKFRSTVNPVMMHPKVMKPYAERIDPVANEFLDMMRQLAQNNPSGEMPENFSKEIHKFTLEVALLVGMDRRIGALSLNLDKNSEAQQLIDKVPQIFELFYKLEFLPSLWRWYSTPDWQRFVKVLDDISDLLFKYIEEEEAAILKGKRPEYEESVFQKLLKLDRKIALGMTMDIINGGVETTGRIISAALYFLAKNKKCQENLRNELTKLLPKKDTQITGDILDKAQYLRAVIKETTRIAPISIGHFRTVSRDMVLNGYQIPEGTDVLTGNLVISTQTDKYFSKPSEFIPERWLRGQAEESSQKVANSFVSLPFGFGSRSCIGKRFANLEIEVILAKIIRNFVLDWPHEDAEFKSVLFYGIASPLKICIKEVSS